MMKALCSLIFVCCILSAKSQTLDYQSYSSTTLDLKYDQQDDNEDGPSWLKRTFNVMPKVGVAILPVDFKANGNSESFVKVIPTFGVDIEMKMPWIENLYLHSNPMYYVINFDREVDVFLVPTQLELELHSGSVPLGFRYYYPINEQGQIFANIGFEVLYDFRDEMTVTPPAQKVIVDSKSTMTYGAGYKKDLWSLELNFKPNYRIFNGSVETSITRFEVRFGYQIF